MFPYFEILGRSFSSYGLFMAAGVLIAATISIRQYSRLGGIGEDVLIVGACGVGLALLCGSVLYAFVTFPPEQILAHIRIGDFSVFGGIVFYGGLIGGFAGAFLGAWLSHCPWGLLERAAVPTIPLGHALGRIGCVMAGCCHGMTYSGPFALYYRASVLGLSPKQGYFPVQPVEAILNLVLFFWLSALSKKARAKGYLLRTYLMAYSSIRFVLEFFRGDSVRGHFLWLSVSQWISVLILTVCFIWKCYIHFNKKSFVQNSQYHK